MKAGWEHDRQNKLTVINILCIVILLLVSYTTCATWFSGPYMLACVGALWAALILLFFKNPAATFIIAVALVFAVLAYPQPLPHPLSSITLSSDSIQSPNPPSQHKEWPQSSPATQQHTETLPKYNDPPIQHTKPTSM
jgi:hypothetical protein